MIPATHSENIHIDNISFPSQMNQMAIWKISSTKDFSVPMQLSYLTSGMDWRAYYAAILSTDEKTMQLNGYVRVNNHCGETYDTAKIFLVMGSVNMLQSIDKLAQNSSPYGQPEQSDKNLHQRRMKKNRASLAAMPMMDTLSLESSVGASPNDIRVDSVSEYAVFEIEQEEQLQNGWGKQLIFLQDQSIPITNVYRFHPEKYGNQVVRLVQFYNKLQSKKGSKKSVDSFPLPGGLIRMYRDIYKKQHFSYEGQTRMDDMPVGKDVEIVLGPQHQVNVEKKRMKIRTDQYQFDADGNISDWDEFFQDRIELNNTRPVSVFIEIICSFDSADFALVQKESWLTFERINQYSVKFSATLSKHSSQGFTYDVTIHRKSPSVVMGTRSRY